jgi:hypothetical protein
MVLYSIEEGGLRRLGRTRLRLQRNAEYMIGDSSSPSSVVVTDFNEDMVFYKHYPYQGNVMRIQRPVFEDLAIHGMTTWLKSGYATHQPERAEHFRKLLGGSSGNITRTSNFVRKRVFVRPNRNFFNPKLDYWRLAEQYGNVGGIDSHKSLTGMNYIIDTDVQRLRELKLDRRFVILKVEKGR